MMTRPHCSKSYYNEIAAAIKNVAKEANQSTPSLCLLDNRDIGYCMSFDAYKNVNLILWARCSQTYSSVHTGARQGHAASPLANKRPITSFK